MTFLSTNEYKVTLHYYEVDQISFWFSLYFLFIFLAKDIIEYPTMVIYNLMQACEREKENNFNINKKEKCSVVGI